MKILSLVLLIYLSVCSNAQTPPDTLWTLHLGDPTLNEAPSSIIQTSDGGFISAGYAHPDSADHIDFWLVKTSESGILEWDTTLGGIGAEHAACIQQTSDLGYIITGTTSSYGAGSSDIWLVKTDEYGNIQWDQTYGGFTWEYGEYVEQTDDGGFIITGSTASYGSGDYDIWIIKTDSFGNINWDITYGGEDADYGECVRRTEDNGYIVCGFTYSVDIGTSDAVVIKLDSSGNISWDENYGQDGWDYSYSIIQTSDLGYILAGSTEIYNQTSDQAALWKLDPEGNVEWNWLYGGISDERASSVLQTIDGGYIFCGATYSFGAGQRDAWVFKTDSQGYHEWNLTLGFSDNESANDIIQTWDGSFIICCGSDSFTESMDLWIVSLGYDVPVADQMIDQTENDLVIYPNPFYGSSSRASYITISSSSALLNGTGISIYDIRGRLVNILEIPAGRNYISWNGKDRYNQDLKSGIYFCRTKKGSTQQFRKLMIVN